MAVVCCAFSHPLNLRYVIFCPLSLVTVLSVEIIIFRCALPLYGEDNKYRLLRPGEGSSVLRRIDELIANGEGV